jgi:tetratricopeptide (TPR) repeat protein
MIAALLLAPLIMAASSPASGLKADALRLEACIAKIDSKPDEAYEDAMVWANETHVRESRVCQALALIALKRIDEGAHLLEQLALSADGGKDEARAVTFSQAGNARLLAYEADQAVSDFDQALHYAPGAPDLLIDRARAQAMLGQWQKAENDLSLALDRRPSDALALRLRAEARLQQKAYDLAQRDAEAALSLEPKNVDALLMRGRVREAMSGRPPSP